MKKWKCVVCDELNFPEAKKYRIGGDYPVCPECKEHFENKEALREEEQREADKYYNYTEEL